MALPLLPQPTSVTTTGPGYRIGARPTIACHPSSAADPSLIELVDQFIAAVAVDHEVQLTRVEQGSADIEVVIVAADEELDALPATSGQRADDRDLGCERYGIEVGPDGIGVWAGHPAGIHRGLTTLRQLLAVGPQLPGLKILDAPRYAWRGLSLDVVRTFFGVAEVRRVIDLLDAYKLNVLHLHLTDDQGWRLEIDGWPELTKIAADGAVGDRPGGYFTQQQLIELIEYAEQRFITIVPEFDLPGHSRALIRAYPEFGTPAPAGQQLPEPIIQLNSDNPQLWDLVTDVLTQLASLAPGRFVHLGGDEAFGLSDEFHRSFLQRAITILHGLGKRVVGWQEASRAGIGSGDVVQYWIDFADRTTEMMPLDKLPPGVGEMLIETFRQAVDDLPRAVRNGAGVIFSPVSYCYLDRPYAEQPTDPSQNALRERLGLPAYGSVTLEDAFDFDPDADLAAAAPGAEIAGVEAAIWCESITSEADLQFLLLPRLTGIAERGWSPAKTTWAEFEPRLAAQTAVWRRRGLTWFTAPALSAGPR